MFVNIEEASGFWKELWEGNRTGNGSAEWLHDLRAIIHDRVPPSVEEAWDLVRGGSNRLPVSSMDRAQD